MARYICLSCSHEWDSHPYNQGREVLRCSECHKRQGISYEKYRSAVEATKSALRKIKESPPPNRLPIEVKDDIPKAFDHVFEIVKNEFPSPLVPWNFLKLIMTQSVRELKDEPISPKRNKK